MLEKSIDGFIEIAEIEHERCIDGTCDLTKLASDGDPFADIKQKKNNAYLYVIAMGAGDYYGCNNNGDFFLEKYLKDYYEKFLTAYVFVQHANKDPNLSIGKVLKALYNDDMHRVELVIEIDGNKAPDIYNRIKSGERMNVSMGVRVPSEYCSYCGAVTKGSIANRCEHLKFKMKQYMDDGTKVCAINQPPYNFFDISIVRKPADFQGRTMMMKVASDDNDIDDKKSEVKNWLVKRIEAIDSIPGDNIYGKLYELKRKYHPDIISGIIVRKSILLKPSEAIALSIPQHQESTIFGVEHEIDHCDSILEEIAEAILKNSGTCGCGDKISLAWGDVDDETIKYLESRTELVKQAYSQDYPYYDFYSGRKRETYGGAHRVMSQIAVKFVNGNEVIYRPKQGKFGIESIPDSVIELVRSGRVVSVLGISQNGDRFVVEI